MPHKFSAQCFEKCLLFHMSIYLNPCFHSSDLHLEFLSACFTFYPECTFLALRAIVSEPKKIECFRPSFPTLFFVPFRETPELYNLRLFFCYAQLKLT